ncbi:MULTISPECIES: hypothetical protein [unclassified Gordonia (in: high G+C Gram-positive bacteria)]|uniref:hypothetical protein n=1 Tax=unclassified Gordonia (in: high G+C Gram-positive bacteria) TaxID=2657482 RepID=UPI00096AAB14|nr:MULTISPECIES: hypothetical protein [unclassified Gordonia (in: high G+C Gram-positive bacteria)]
MEAHARRLHGDNLRIIEGPYALGYQVDLDVRGPNDLVLVTVVFYARPAYDTYGLHAEDYPRVWAELGMPSKHRMSEDDALCLYYPLDPPSRRWTATKGLNDLLDVTVDHLGYEAYWRATGGHAGGEWLGDEAEHGFPTVDAA